MSRLNVINRCKSLERAVAGLIVLSILLISGCRTAEVVSEQPGGEGAAIREQLNKGITITVAGMDNAGERKPGESGMVTTALEVPAAPAAESNGPAETLSALPVAPAPLPATPEAAEPASETDYALTLENLERIALGYNPTIPQAGSLIRQQEGFTIQAGLYPNPQAGYVRSDPDHSGQSRTSGVFLSQTFITGGKLRLAQEASQHDVTLRAWQLDAQQQRVVNDVRIGFYEVLGAQRAIAAAEDLERSAAEGVRIAKELVDAQRAGRPDLLQAEMQFELARGAVKDAEYRLLAARRHLASLAGVEELPEGDAIGSLDDSIPELEWETSLQRLLDESPLLKSQAAELQAAQTEVRLARAQAVPNLNVQAVAQRDSVKKFNSVSTLVSLPVPVFNRNQGGIVQAQAFLTQQQREYDRLRQALSDQLAASFQQYSSFRSEAERVESELLPRAKENLELTTEAYRLGRMDFLRVVDARRTYFQTRMSQIDALTALHKVVAEIEGLQLTGGLNPTEIGTALQTTPGRPGAGSRRVLFQQLQSQSNTSQRNLPGALQATEK